jgi:predicted RNase H-like HicB family nuclease
MVQLHSASTWHTVNDLFEEDERMEFNKINDGEGFEMELGTSHMIACCDCGLVHQMAIAKETNGMIGLAFKVDEEETTNRRGTPNKHRMHISWSDEDDAWIVDFPELPGCLAHGKTIIEAMAMAQRVSAEWLRIAKYNDWSEIKPCLYKQTP